MVTRITHLNSNYDSLEVNVNSVKNKSIPTQKYPSNPKQTKSNNQLRIEKSFRYIPSSKIGTTPPNPNKKRVKPTPNKLSPSKSFSNGHFQQYNRTKYNHKY